MTLISLDLSSGLQITGVVQQLYRDMFRYSRHISSVPHNHDRSDVHDVLVSVGQVSLPDGDIGSLSVVLEETVQSEVFGDRRFDGGHRGGELDV